MLDAVENTHFAMDPDTVDEMDDMQKAYIFSSTYEPLYFSVRHFKDELEGILEDAERLLDLIENNDFIGFGENVTVSDVEKVVRPLKKLDPIMRKSIAEFLMKEEKEHE